MTGDRLEQLERYDRGELDPNAQAALELELGSDPELRALLDDVREASRLTEQLRASRSLALPRELPVVSGYDVERELHRGGQGVVYLATQRSTGQRVALKALLSGRASTERQQQRLEREIELAASIQHPGVVTVFDRAMTDDGRPVLVMELIEGVPLDAHTREQKPSVRQTLSLIAEIARVVSAAHQRGVIHRDLKPSNVMIDRDGRPRVLDFGLAKAFEPDQTRSVMTQEGEFMGTLAYSGPEQVERGAGAADVRTDVYALGAMLAEALTGELPIDVSGPLAGAIGRIRETEPAPPSSLRGGIDEDIDTIVLTAMAKDPGRRYQSAASLAEDIERCLRDEPILARQASAMYQLRKFARRHRAIAVVTCAVVLALLVTTAVVTAALIRMTAANTRAMRANEAALIDADKQTRLNAFLRRLLTSVEPGNAGPDLKVVSLLEDAEGRIETEFADYPDLRATLHTTLAQTYWRLGLLEPARAHQESAISLLENLGPDAPQGDLPAAISELGSIAHSQGDLNEAGELHRRAARLWERVELAGDPRRMRARVNHAAVHSAKGDARIAEESYLQAIAGLTQGDEQSRILRAQAFVSLGALYRPLERFDEARAAYDQALPILEQIRGPEHPDTLACLGNMAEVLVSLGDTDRAEQTMRELIEIRRRVFGPRHERVAIAINNLADLLRAENRPDEAIPLFEEARSIFAESLGEKHFRVAMTSHNLGLTLTRSGRAAEALPVLQSAHDTMGGAVPSTHWILAQMRLSLGEAYLGLGQPSEALPLIRDAHERFMQEFGAGHTRTQTAARLLTTAEAAPSETDTDVP